MRFCTLVSAICILTSSGLARTPGFDPQDVVRQVRSRHSTTGPLGHLATGFDDGEFLIDTNRTFAPAPYNQRHPALAFDGVNFLVVWSDGRTGSSACIYGARVTPSGVVLDPAGVAISAVTNGGGDPVIAFDGENFLVVWQDERGGSYYDIYGTRVTPAGVLLDSAGIAISTAAWAQCSPAIAFGGENFLVVWEDPRSGSLYDVYGARVTPAGAVLDSGPVVRQEGAQRRPALGHGAGSQMLLVYQGWTGTVGGETYNADRIWGKMNPSPAIAEMTKPEVRTANGGATIVPGVLFLEARGEMREARSELLDVSGRKVLDLKPGVNDVRALAPGVYFIRVAQAQAQAQAVRKVIVTR